MEIASCGSPTDCHWHWLDSLSSDWDCRVSFFTGETQRHCRQRRSLCHLWWRRRCLSLVNRGTHLRLHGTYQTSHGRPHCPIFILMSLLLSQIPGNAQPQQQWTVLNLKQHCHTASATPITLVPGWVIGTDTVSVTAAVSHIVVSVMGYLVHVYRSHPS